MLPEIGLLEILVVAVVAMLVLKPHDFPLVMRKLGLWSSTARQNLHGMYQGWLEQADQQTKQNKP